MPYVASKISADVEYAGWSKGKNGLNKKEHSVLIKGGANVLNKKTMETPNGVITEITKEELEFLKSNSTFKRHEKGGWVKVFTSKDAAQKHADTVIKNEDGKTVKDAGSQLTEEDFEENGQKAPIVNGK